MLVGDAGCEQLNFHFSFRSLKEIIFQIHVFTGG